MTENKLEDFPFNENLLSCRNKGTFPDMAIRLNTNREVFSGGELIELKDSNTYTVSSFNSTIPTGRKEIAKIITGENSGIKQQMQENGNDIYSLPVRDVFYLVRGKNKGDIKICLVHGSFFETIRIEDLISQSFLQVLEERLKDRGESFDEDVKRKLLTILSEQQSFSKVRDVNKSSVKLRFRVMTEVKAEGNILNLKKYPEIKDNTLNFVLPCHNENEEKEIIRKAESIFSKTELKQFSIFKVKHHFNGYFLVLQTSL
ncbi:MAG: hypothetical protein HY752_03635 [Nitrospirae bacterium]|nr:hypothetical protein [Nitrospirota bacterium]